MNITLKGLTVQLTPHRAAYIEAHNTIFVSDLHLGKAATLRQYGIPLSEEASTRSDLNRLSSIVTRYNPSELFVVGDLIHSRSGVVEEVMRQVRSWRNLHQRLNIFLVPGNHDLSVEALCSELQITILPEETRWNGLTVSHFPSVQTNISGHLHPAVRLRGRHGNLPVLPCFALKGDSLILPSFGSTTGYCIVKMCDYDGVYGVANEELIDLSNFRR